MELKENIYRLIQVRQHYDNLEYEGGKASERLAFLEHCRQCSSTIDRLCKAINENINNLEKDHATEKLNYSQFKAGLQPLHTLLLFFDQSPKFSPQALNRQHIEELVQQHL